MQCDHMVSPMRTARSKRSSRSKASPSCWFSKDFEDLIDAEAVVLLDGGSGLIVEGKRSVHAKHGLKASILHSSSDNSGDVSM